MSQSSFDVDRFRKSFLLLLVVAISAIFLAMVQSFLVSVLLAAIFTALCAPIQRVLVKLFNGRVGLASAATLIMVLFLIVGPLLTFFSIVAGQAVEVSAVVKPLLEAGVDANRERPLLDRIELPAALVPYQAQIITKAGEVAGNIGNYLVGSLAAATRGTASFLFSLFIMLYSMFYFLRDGTSVLELIFYYMPLRHDEEMRMAERFVSVSRATLKGTLVIGAIQGGLAGLAFAVVGIQGPAFWGTVMAVLSIIPGVGTALVWVPAAIWLGVTGSTGAAIGLTIWCVVAVGTIDNVLRPILVGRDTQMSDLLIMLSTLGGLFLFGAVGIVVGPIIAALFVTVWEIYGESFSDYLPDVRLSQQSGGVEPAE